VPLLYDIPFVLAEVFVFFSLWSKIEDPEICREIFVDFPFALDRQGYLFYVFF
jgi:hypothetical protein